ncbi:MAG TPA: hypothetical protein VL989_01280 [Candidatus Sulfotelmatobacter sp.]|nr:hypothetical protein [Candidatus Sulfotelmatobacter sp.]
MKQFITNKIMIASFMAISTITGAALITATSYASTPNLQKVYQATCTIGNVPATLAIGQSMTPTITVTNTGNYTIGAHFISFVDNNDGPTTYFKEVNVTGIKPGESKTKNLGKYTVPSDVTTTGTDNASVYAHSDLNYPNTKTFFQCSTEFTIIQ